MLVVVVSAIAKLTINWCAGEALAEVPGGYVNSDKLLLKQASHMCVSHVRVVVACAPELACLHILLICLCRPSWLCLLQLLSGSASDAVTLRLPNCMCCVVCMQAFCKDVLQRPAEEMPSRLCNLALPRYAMRYYWLQAHGHRITAKMSFAEYSPAKFAERYGSTEEAIEEWRQHWLQSPEGRLYGGGGEGARVSRWAPQNLLQFGR